MNSRRRPSPRTGFTLVELLVAGVITAMVLGSVAFSLSNLTGAKNAANRRMQAYLRADAALETLRSDVTSILRKSDLFYTRLLIEDADIATDRDIMDRDMILLFSTKLRSIHEIDYTGEGMEYETQFRILDDQLGPVMWRRRDPVPEEYPDGGGVVTPIVEGVVSINFEAYDGEEWQYRWDSDIDGLPLAVRITVIASGHRQGEDSYAENVPLATLRTIVPIDRVPVPPVEPEEEEEQDPAADGEPLDGGDGGDGGSSTGGSSGGFDGGDRPPNGGGRGPGTDRPGGGRRPGNDGGGRGTGGGRGNNTNSGQSSSDQRIFEED